MSALATAGLTGLAVWLLWSPPPRVPGPPGAVRQPSQRRWATPGLAAVLAAIAVVTVLPGVTGWVAAVAVGAAVHRWVGGLERSHVVRRRAVLVQDLPVAADLIGAALAAGRAPQDALAAVADAWAGPVADDLHAILARLQWCADPATAWEPWLDDDAWGPAAAAFIRSGRSGAAVTQTLARAAEDLRRRRRWAARARARAVGVRTAAPLGLCFLPAFLLVGIVPLVVGVVGTIPF